MKNRGEWVKRDSTLASLGMHRQTQGPAGWGLGVWERVWESEHLLFYNDGRGCN